jgi:uncharacterized protein YecE (DUF72 family)
MSHEDPILTGMEKFDQVRELAHLEEWVSPTANVDDHLYSLDELEPWVARVKSIGEDTNDTYVVTNNHNLGKSTVNALELQAFLSGGSVEVPPCLRESYRELQQIAKKPEDCG